MTLCCSAGAAGSAGDGPPVVWVSVGTRIGPVDTFPFKASSAGSLTFTNLIFGESPDTSALWPTSVC